MEILFDVKICRTVAVCANQDLVLLILQQSLYCLAESEGLAGAVGSTDQDGGQGEGGGGRDGDDGLPLLGIEGWLAGLGLAVRPLQCGAPGDLLAQQGVRVHRAHAGERVHGLVHLYNTSLVQSSTL